MERPMRQQKKITLSGTMPIFLILMMACGPRPDIAFNASVLKSPLTGRCDPATNLQSPFTNEVQTLRLVAYPHTEGDVVAMEGPVGESITLDNLSIGETYGLSLFGKNASGDDIWRGSTNNIVTQESQTTNVNILLGRIRDLSCARTVEQEARAFHTATTLNDGSVLIVGGATTMAATNSCSGCKSLTATATVSLFDPGTGAFSTVAQMAQGRMFHAATRLSNGSVLITGGASSATINPNEPFPLVPENGAMLSAIELYDPATGTITNLGEDPGGPRVFHAATTLSSGRVIISGGVQSVVSPFNLSNATSSTTLCDEVSLVCQTGPVMQQARAGHSTFELASGLTFVWGGAVGTSYQMERLDQNASAFSLLTVAAMSASRNLFFAATAAYNDNRLLAAGGLVRNNDGSFELATADYYSTARGPLYVYVPEHGTAGGISVGNTQTADPPPFAILGPVFMGQATPIGDGSRVMITGGFGSLDLTPVAHMALFDESQLSVFEPANDVGALMLSQERGGHTAVNLGTGQLLFTGGVSTLAGGNGIELTATSTIYTDEKEVLP